MARTRRPQRPGLTLVIFLLLCAALYLPLVIGKVWSPKLGLDLQGGTTITLTARTSSGGAVSATSLEEARNIIQQRVDGLGVGESEVTTEGDRNIVVSVPNADRDALVAQVGKTAKLSFRNVYAAAEGGPVPAETSGSPSPSGTPKPQDPASPTAPPGLPTAPPEANPSASASARPSAEPSKKLTNEQAIAWQPSQSDQAEFQTWTCSSDALPLVSNQPFFACDESGVKYLLGPEVIPGEQVSNASSGIPDGKVSYAVILDFNDAGTAAFTADTQYLSTQQAPMNQFAIVLDGRVVSAPRVEKVIPGGSATIEGGGINQQSAAQLANMLKYGALPLTFDVATVDTVSATLGSEQLRGGIIAGIIGLALVAVYALIYYRALGIVIITSLLLAAGVTYPVLVILGQAVGYSLSLPGIAGAILAIGVTADSFIIYFERIRDEVRDGRSLKSAIETGWLKARGTVVVADSVSLLSAVVLFILAVGSVKGFAFTLGVTTFIDILVAFFFTKPLVSLLGRTKYFGQGKRFSGMDAEHMGVSQESLLGRRRSVRTKTKEA